MSAVIQNPVQTFRPKKLVFGMLRVKLYLASHVSFASGGKSISYNDFILNVIHYILDNDNTLYYQLAVDMLTGVGLDKKTAEIITTECLRDIIVITDNAIRYVSALNKDYPGLLNGLHVYFQPNTDSVVFDIYIEGPINELCRESGC